MLLGLSYSVLLVTTLIQGGDVTSRYGESTLEIGEECKTFWDNFFLE